MAVTKKSLTEKPSATKTTPTKSQKAGATSHVQPSKMKPTAKRIVW